MPSSSYYNPSTSSYYQSKAPQSSSSNKFSGRNSQYEKDQACDDLSPGTLEALPSVTEFAPANDRMRTASTTSTAPITRIETNDADGGVEYEEVPPWNYPRSIDDLHFTYSLRCETIGCRIFRLLTLLIPGGLILLGATNTSNCLLVPWLPYWVIIVGILWMVHCCFYFLFRQSTEKNTKGYRFLKGVFLYCCLGAFATGTALTYGSINRLNLGRITSSNHCSPYLFFAATGMVSLGYLAICIFLYFYTFTFQFSFYEPELQ